MKWVIKLVTLKWSKLRYTKFVKTERLSASWFSAVWPFQVLEGMFMRTYASSRVKTKIFCRKSELQMFLLISGGHTGHQFGTPIWRLHRKLYKGAWNVSANNSETVNHKDLRLEKIVYILVFYNISFSWLLPLDGFQFIFLVAWQWKRSIFGGQLWLLWTTNVSMVTK